ncbi:MAG: 2-oxo acid dehydrogenase subunit E2 [Treponema sp.]|jgi:pyruvate dehydrogenase E2 component (dihydrolipoamide acetyltransferase)|nr:2-oxo acid dehydrogenase subunit E2 [Treponema sp.]
MAEKIIMPKQGLQMTEGTIVEWLVAEGGAVKEGEPLFTIETDKVTITIDALVSGTLLKIVAGPGVTVPITGLIAVVGAPGEDIGPLLAEAGNAAPAAASAPAAVASVPPQTARESGGRVFISPRAKKLAGEQGLDWRLLTGTGPDGMIVERDVAASAAGVSRGTGSAARATPLAARLAAGAGVDLAEVSGTGAGGKITRGDVERARARTRRATARAEGGRKIIPLRGMRKIIAERMKQSQNENAQTCHRVSVRMDEAVKVRAAFDKKVSYNDLAALAVVRALRDFPEVNAELTPDGIWQKEFVNLGVAVALDDGLIVPVVKDADLLSIGGLAAAIRELAEKARAGTLRPDEYSGGSFTLSNLGMFGLEEFVAIINPPEAGILAVGKIEDAPVAVQKGDGSRAVEIHPLMKLTLSYDHRVVDGAPAAQFLARIKEYLEQPYLML